MGDLPSATRPDTPSPNATVRRMRMSALPGSAYEACSRSTRMRRTVAFGEDRKSTRLNSSHLVISYAVFCLKKKICIHKGARVVKILFIAVIVSLARFTSPSDVLLLVNDFVESNTIQCRCSVSGDDDV